MLMPTFGRRMHITTTHWYCSTAKKIQMLDTPIYRLMLRLSSFQTAQPSIWLSTSQSGKPNRTVRTLSLALSESLKTSWKLFGRQFCQPVAS